MQYFCRDQSLSNKLAFVYTVVVERLLASAGHDCWLHIDISTLPLEIRKGYMRHLSQAIGFNKSQSKASTPLMLV
jgi:hypothetical protein